MKKVLLTLAAALISAAAVQAADGQFILGSRDTSIGFDKRSTLVGGPLNGQFPNNLYQLQVFSVGAGGAETPLTPVVTFRTGTTTANTAGYFANTAITVPNASGAPQTFRVKAFDAGANYETATTYRGIAEFTTTAAIAPNPPDLATTFPGVQLQFVPEPSTIALAALGGAALLFRRRK